MGLFKTWKEKRAYHKDNAKTIKLGKGEKLTPREKAIRSQGYMAGQRSAWDESSHKNTPDRWEQTLIKRKMKKEEYDSTK